MKKEIQDIEFDSVLDLYNRVKPALRTKLKELKREKYDYIKEEDVWNYLIKTKWSNAHGLVLCLCLFFIYASNFSFSICNISSTTSQRTNP